MGEKWKKSLAYEKLQKLKEDMKPMTFWEKIGHLWYCYNIYFIVALVVVVMIGSFLVSTLDYQSKDRLVNGILVNLSIDQKGMNYLSGDYKEYLNAEEEQIVDFEYIYVGKLTENSSEDAYNRVLSILARVDGKMLDYMILDKDGMETFIVYDVYLDLREFFTPEEITQLAAEKRLIYAQIEGEEEQWPVAVKITDIPFVKDNVNDEGDVYFTLAGREPNLEVCRNVWDYLHAWEKEAES